jgi:hypothetical protein
MAAVATSLLPSIASAQTDTEPPLTPPPTTMAPTTTPPPTTTLPPPTEVVPPPPAAEPTAVPTKTEPTATCPGQCDGAERILKGHTFLYPAFVASPIVATYLGLRIRTGDQAASNAPTAVGNRDITALTLSETLDLGIKITDWFAFTLTGGVRAIIGSNLPALTYGGATYDVGGRAGLLFRLMRNEDTGTQLGIGVGAAVTRGQVSTLFPLFAQPLQSAVDALQGDLGESIKTPFTTTNFDASFSVAQALAGKLLGLQASAGIGRGSITAEPYDSVRKVRISSTESSATYEFGAALSFDFNAFKVPIAVMPEYVFTRQTSTAPVRGSGVFDTIHIIALGIYYSGRPNLQFGLISSAQLGTNPLLLPNGPSDTPVVENGELILRYIW